MKSLKKTIAMLVAFVMLLTVIVPGPAMADNSTAVIPDGEYPVPYRYVKDGTTQTSAANTYVLPNTGKLIVQDGQVKFEHEVEKSIYTTFAYLGARKAGAAKAVIGYNEDGTESAAGLEGYLPVVVRDAADAKQQSDSTARRHRMARSLGDHISFPPRKRSAGYAVTGCLY